MDAIWIARNTAFSAATGAKTVLKLITGSTFNVKIHEIGISMDGVTATAVPATVDLFTSDETTAGTSGASVPTIQQIKGRAQASGCTLGHNFTAEGTTYTVLKSFYVPQYMGLVIIQNPLGLEEQAPGGDVADSVGIRINTSATVNVLAWIKFSKA